MPRVSHVHYGMRDLAAAVRWFQDVLLATPAVNNERMAWFRFEDFGVNLAEAVAGAPIRGSWWGHRKGREIFRLTRAVRASPEVLVCRLVDGKITYVHRRMWPALVRLSDRFERKDLAAVHEMHMRRGHHEARVIAFGRWLPARVKRQAHKLTEAKAVRAFGE